MELQIDIDSQVKRISPLTKKGFFGKLVGEYRSAFRGRGLEFTGFRGYDQSDDAIRIDWKASLRSQDLLVRQFEEERNLSVLFIFDTSDSMLYSSTGKLKAEYAAEFIGALAYGILHAEDSVGLLMFNDDLRAFLAPHIGDKQFFTITEELKNMRNYGGPKNYEKLIKFCMNTLSKTTIIFLVTDFIGLPEEDFLINAFLSKFEVVGFMIRDKNDNELPIAGNATISDPFTHDEILIDTERIKSLYDEYARKQRMRVAELFRKSQDDIIEIMTTDDYLKVLLRFFMHRQGKQVQVV